MEQLQHHGWQLLSKQHLWGWKSSPNKQVCSMVAIWSCLNLSPRVGIPKPSVYKLFALIQKELRTTISRLLLSSIIIIITIIVIVIIINIYWHYPCRLESREAGAALLGRSGEAATKSRLNLKEIWRYWPWQIPERHWYSFRQPASEKGTSCSQGRWGGGRWGSGQGWE